MTRSTRCPAPRARLGVEELGPREVPAVLLNVLEIAGRVAPLAPYAVDAGSPTFTGTGDAAAWVAAKGQGGAGGDGLGTGAEINVAWGIGND